MDRLAFRKKKPVLLNAFIFREEMMRTSTMKRKT